jgi:zinc protease
MVEKYLGSLKDSKRTEKWIDRKVTNAQGLTKKQIEIPLTTPKANINIFFFNDIAYTPKTNLQIQLLDAILDLRYTETVREEEGGTYGVSVRGGISKFPREEASLSINFDCDPLRAENLKAIIYREIEKIKIEGPTEVDLDKTIKNLLKDREQSREHNNFWMSSLSNYYHLGINFADTANYEEVLKKMTKEEMKAFANTFFNNADNLDIVFLPSANK